MPAPGREGERLARPVRLAALPPQLPTPPQVAKVLGRSQSPMFMLEHVTPNGQPDWSGVLCP
jgi:hypothetical protein